MLEVFLLAAISWQLYMMEECLICHCYLINLGCSKSFYLLACFDNLHLIEVHEQLAIMKENLCTKYFPFTYNDLVLNEKPPIMKENLRIFFIFIGRVECNLISSRSCLRICKNLDKSENFLCKQCGNLSKVCDESSNLIGP